MNNLLNLCKIRKSDKINPTIRLRLIYILFSNTETYKFYDERQKKYKIVPHVVSTVYNTIYLAHENSRYYLYFI